MMLEDHIARALPELRRHAESRMVDRCRITVPAGDPVFDPETGEYSTPDETVVYEGRCEVQASDGLGESTPQFGDAAVTTYRFTVKVPISVTGLAEGQDGEILSSRWDPDLPGTQFIIRAWHGKSHATSRRLEVEVVG